MNPATVLRKTMIAIIGTTVLIFGIILIFTPGPAFVFIPLGLFILASEFILIRRIIRKLNENNSKKGKLLQYIDKMVQKLDKD